MSGDLFGRCDRCGGEIATVHLCPMADPDPVAALLVNLATAFATERAARVAAEADRDEAREKAEAVGAINAALRSSGGVDALTIFKFPIQITDDIYIEMPSVVRVLCVAVQPGYGPCVWVLVEPETPYRRRHLRIAGTGHPLSATETDTYVGTFQIEGGRLVFHLFDCGWASG